MLGTTVTILAASEPNPPVFPPQYSMRVRDVVHQGPGTQSRSCDLHFDAVNNLTSYRNCGAPIKPGGNGSQEQMVYRFSDKGRDGSNTGTVYFIYGSPNPSSLSPRPPATPISS